MQTEGAENVMTIVDGFVLERKENKNDSRSR